MALDTTAEAFANNYAYATLTFDSVTITNSDIIQGSLSINGYASTGNYLEIGTAIASEMSVTLENTDGRFDSIDFLGQECYVSTYTIVDGTTYTQDIGYYIVDEYKYSEDRVYLKALDRMSKLDVAPAVLEDFSEPEYKLYMDDAYIRYMPTYTTTTIFAETIEGTAYTVTEITDNAFGRWAKLSSSDSVYTYGTTTTTTAGDNAWVCLTNGTGNEGFKSYNYPGVWTDVVMSGVDATAKQILQMEIAVNNAECTNYGIIDLTSDAWAALETIYVETFTLGNNFSLRQFIAYCAGVLGKNAYINTSGVLDFTWYDTVTPTYTYTPSYAYNMELNKDTVSITGFMATVNGTEYSYGSGDYMLEMRDNAVLNAFGHIYVDSTSYWDLADYLECLYNNLTQVSYTPFTASVLQCPKPMVMDVIYYTDGEETFTCPITDWTWTLNGATAIRGRGANTVLKSAVNYGSTITDNKIAYELLYGKPSINGVTLIPGLTSSDLFEATSPIDLTDSTISHDTSGVTAGTYGANSTTALTPAFGGTFYVNGFKVNDTGHITSASHHTVKIPSTAASASSAGLMSASDYSKLSGIASSATKNTIGGRYNWSVWASSASVATGTWTKKGQITLAAGWHVLAFTVNWAASSSASGAYRSCLSTTSAAETPANGVLFPCTGTATRYMQTVIVHPTSSTTYYFNIYQNSGAALNCSVYLNYLSIT